MKSLKNKRPMSLYQELKRRNVIRVGMAYIVAAWLVIQVTETIFPLFGIADALARLVVIVLAIGFIPALIFAWAFELTPEGLKKESEVDRTRSINPHTGKKLDRAIMVALVFASGYFAFDKFVLAPQRNVALTESAIQMGAEQAKEEARLDMFKDKSVAVLPFTNRSEKKEDEYFTDGMHDELLTRLSRIAALKVISRTSMMRYRNTEKTIPEIARELSVATVLEGGVQRSGSQIRINVQLINAQTDEHMWAEIYDRKLTAENLFAIQSEISTEIADALQATLSPEEKSRVYDLPTSSLEAYNHFLRGRQLMATRGKEDLEQARDEFEQAADIDPEFALAWVGVADVVHLLTENGTIDFIEHREMHRQAVDKALALNDQLGEAYASLSFYYLDMRESEKSEAAMLKAIELNPNYAQAYHWYANIRRGPERKEKRLALLYKAAQLDPLSSIVQLNLAGAYWQLGQEEQARQRLEQLIQTDPDFAPAYSGLADYDATYGQLAKAVQGYRKAAQMDPGNGIFMFELALTFLSLGDFETIADIREDMDKHLGSENWRGWALDNHVLTAQSKWPETIDRLDALSPQYRDLPEVKRGYTDTWLYSGDFQKARAYLLEYQPFVTDRAQWQKEFIAKNRINCEYAGILIATGDQALGRDLLQLFMQELKAATSTQPADYDQSIQWITCHLVDGAYEKALDILDQETARGRLIYDWWDWGKLPWWKQLEDNPRYITLMGRIEAMLAEQRELLNEMDKSGSFVP